MTTHVTARVTARVAVLSDTHIGAAGDDQRGTPEAALAATVDALLAHAEMHRFGRYDLVVLAGDITDAARPEQFAETRRLLGPLLADGTSLVATAGNHDESASVAAAFGSTTEATIATGPGDAAWRVVLVDTVVPGEVHGAVDVAGVADALGDDHGLARPTLLVLHHPPITPSTHPWFQLQGAGELVTLVSARGDVRAVVSGHVHHRFDLSVGDIRFLGAPSTWYAIEHDGDRYALAPAGTVGAMVLALDGSAVSAATITRRGSGAA